MPYLYHAFVSAKTDSADSGLVRPTNWNDRFEYGNVAASGPSGTDAFIRETLLASRSYYVRTDGSDSNNGLTDSAAGAFLTIQKATDTVYTLDINGQAVTLQVRAGTYTGAITVDGPYTGSGDGGSVTLTGDTVTPGNVIISVTSNNAVLVQGGAVLSIAGFKVQTTTNGDCLAVASKAKLSITGQMEFGATAGSHITLTTGASVIVAFGTNATISGGAPAGAFWITNGGGSYLQWQGGTITLTGTPVFSTFAVTQSLSNMVINANTFVGGASAGTQRYSATANSVIETFGSGAAYLPGGVAGTTGSGGIYE